MPDIGLISQIMDDYGTYEVPATSIFATARRRRDGWWDLRFNAGKEAQRQYRENRDRREREFIEGVE